MSCRRVQRRRSHGARWRIAAARLDGAAPAAVLVALSLFCFARLLSSTSSMRQAQTMPGKTRRDGTRTSPGQPKRRAPHANPSAPSSGASELVNDTDPNYQVRADHFALIEFRPRPDDIEMSVTAHATDGSGQTRAAPVLLR
jgi:hypothetical protein